MFHIPSPGAAGNHELQHGLGAQAQAQKSVYNVHMVYS